MDIRIANLDEFKELWKYSGTPTYNYFVKNIESNNVEFWTIDKGRTLIGELYIFWDSEDKDEANGKDRAYLCAFRVQEEHQGKGYGAMLIEAVFERIHKVGYKEVTIGIDNDEFEKLNSMYERFGFTEEVKETTIDHHFMDENNKPVTYNKPYKIMMRKV